MCPKESFIQQLLDRLDLSDEELPGKPLVELWGDCRVLVENHQGIIEYTPERIGVRVCYGSVQIHGHNLRLHRVSGRKLLILGMIQNIDLRKRCDK